MSKINIRCPACNKLLEIDEESLGEEVECGECLEVFEAKEPESEKPSPPETKTSSRSRKKPARRRDYVEEDGDDDDDFDYSRRAGHQSGGGSSAAAVVGLVLGIISIPMSMCCLFFSLPLSITAIVLGAISLKQPRSSALAISAILTGLIGALISVGLFIFTLAIHGFNLMNQPWPGK
jgi:phage FluMu protein Com